MRKAGARKMKGVKFVAEVEEHDSAFAALLREDGSVTYERVSNLDAQPNDTESASASRLALITTDDPGPGYGFKGKDGVRLQLKHHPCRFIEGDDAPELSEIYEGAEEDDCGFCTIVLSAVRFMAAGEIPQDAHVSLRRDTDNRLIVNLATGDKVNALEVFRKESDSTVSKYLNAIPIGWLLPASTGSDEACMMIKCRLEECLHRHKAETCRHDGHSSRLPSRVISIGQTSSDPIFVLETSGNRGRYACLSWCWGQVRPLRTTMANLAAHKRAIEWSDLPLAFQDAIKISRRLDIRYIWIDALCIIQDLPQDWEVESARMAKIYGNAFLTLCAAASTDSTQSIFRNLPENFVQHAIDADAGIFARTPILHDHLIDLSAFTEADDIPKQDHPIFYRAWTYQEMLLSPRIVVFGSSEVAWRCQSDITCSCSPTAAHRTGHRRQRLQNIRREAVTLFGATDVTAGTLTLRSAQTLWHRLVECYSSKELAYAADILPALSGIAKTFLPVRKGQYLAGLWTDNLVEDLCWYASRMAGVYNQADLRERNSSSFMAPSWSWATHLQPVMFATHVHVHKEWIEVLEAACVSSTMDPTGRVRTAHILLKGQLHDWYLHPDTLDIERTGQLLYTRDPPVDKSVRHWFPDYRTVDLRERFSTKTVVYAMPVASYVGDWSRNETCYLILRSVKTPARPDHALDTYERLGVCLTHGQPESGGHVKTMCLL